VNTQYGVNRPDKRKLIDIALKKLPEKYIMAFSTLNVANGRNVELETFEESIFHATKSKSNKKDKEDEEELNLATIDAKKKKFNKNNKKKKNTEDGEKCKHCGQVRHEHDRCWMHLTRIKINVLTGSIQSSTTRKNNDSNKMGAVSCSSSGYDGPERLWSALSFPRTLKLLEDPIIWIADMAVTCDSMPHNIGAEKVHKGDKLTGGLSLVTERIMWPPTYLNCQEP
jgi:hypothetical protein